MSLVNLGMNASYTILYFLFRFLIFWTDLIYSKGLRGSRSGCSTKQRSRSCYITYEKVPNNHFPEKKTMCKNSDYFRHSFHSKQKWFTVFIPVVQRPIKIKVLSGYLTLRLIQWHLRITSKFMTYGRSTCGHKGTALLNPVNQLNNFCACALFTVQASC
jgi:hypothetical protein